MNERGIALPLAVIVLAILSSLMLAFSVIATTEPQISANHLRASQARALAESGMERAIWALSNPTDPNGIPDPMATAASPYDGSALVTLGGEGGFTMLVTNGATSSERTLTAVGWAPTNDPADPRPKSQRMIQATLTRLTWLDPKGALAVAGELHISGNATIDARSGACPGGPPPEGGTMTTGLTTVAGGAKVYGPGDSAPNQLDDIKQGTLPTNFTPMFSDGDFATLREIAKKNGTYYQGSVTFNSTNPMPNGIVFVDTTTGADFTALTPDSERGYASVGGGVNASGWLVVAGTITIGGSTTYNGLVYAQNDITYTGAGSGTITGAMITENRKDTVATVVDSNVGGNASITYDCTVMRTGGGTLSTGWFVKAGSYKDVASQ
ncbi:MAG: pilus assembly PilX N-terminal domain-containing protein [Candidatus Rokubacteria bacterium]|nr:pilus assembly PilX N-terminal domain-containing protein [Candidatus Rokubacteria bacterium]